MWLHLINYLQKHRKYFPLILVLIGVLILTLPALFTTKHYSYNLEPYPDGLWYALSGKNFLTTGKFAFLTADTAVILPVPNLYPAVISIGYLLVNSPIAFFIINILLILGTCSLIYSLIYETTKSILAATASLTVYLSHSVVIWLVSVPMTENLALFLLSVYFYCILQKKLSLKGGIVAVLAMCGIFLTRYSLVPTVCIGVLIVAYRALQTVSIGIRKKLFLTIALTAMIGLVLLLKIGQSYLEYLARALNEVWYGSPYFGFKFLLPNLFAYYRLLLGYETTFLWERVTLTTAPIFLLSILGNFFYFQQKKYFQSIVVILISLSSLVAPILFYVQDARYSSFLLIGISLCVGWWVATIGSFKNNKKKYFYVLSALCILGQIFSQKALLQKIIAANILHRSTAWQYEAIIHFNEVFKDKNQGYLISALPPFLVGEYQRGSYQVLPLSANQEFFNKKQQAWGSTVPTTDLRAYFRQLLMKKNEVYITNAYITHSRAVIEEYQTLEELFTFIPVSEGCLKSCNVYKLQLK